MRAKRPHWWLMIHALFLIISGLVATWSVAAFIRFRALLPTATDPTDGIGYALIVSGLISFAAGGVFLGTLVSFFMGRPSRNTPSEPDAY